MSTSQMYAYRDNEGTFIAVDSTDGDGVWHLSRDKVIYTHNKGVFEDYAADNWEGVHEWCHLRPSSELYDAIIFACKNQIPWEVEENE